MFVLNIVHWLKSSWLSRYGRIGTTQLYIGVVAPVLSPAAPGSHCRDRALRRIGKKGGHSRGGRILAELARRRKDVLVIDVAQDAQDHVTHVALALGTPAGLAGRVDGGQEQPDQNADDADHHQQLDQCESSTTTTGGHEQFLSEKEIEAEIDFSRARPLRASTGDKLNRPR